MKLNFWQWLGLALLILGIFLWLRRNKAADVTPAPVTPGMVVPGLVTHGMVVPGMTVLTGS